MPEFDIVQVGALPEDAVRALGAAFNIRRPDEAGAAIRGMARGFGHSALDGALFDRFPRLEIVASFGVGYDGIDLAAAVARNIIVTNTPDVLTEEVADTTLGLLLMTVRELSAAERHLRVGKWPAGDFPLTGTLRDRRVGIAGLGRIGLAIARRLDAMQVPVVYHARHPRPEVPYRYFSDLHAMAIEVDTLIAILPGGEETHNRIDAGILKALGANGVLINVGRGSTVDEAALIAALKNGVIRAAGLDVFADEPNVPPELVALPNAVLLPHVGSASKYTRAAMGQIMVDNLRSWFADRRPLTPVPETPWPPKG